MVGVRDDGDATSSLRVGDLKLAYHGIASVDGVDGLPRSRKLLVENVLRCAGPDAAQHAAQLAFWDPGSATPLELEFEPGRVLMHDTTGVPALVDLATLRSAVARRGRDAAAVQVKTSLAPGSQVVMDYLDPAQLLACMEKLGFGLVGFGCTTCIGNSGPLAGPVRDAVVNDRLKLPSVLSGNRNFEGRISPDVATNYLASPPLVVAYALAGSLDIDLTREPLGTGADGRPVHLAGIWPSSEEIARTVGSSLPGAMFTGAYASLLDGDERWEGLSTPQGAVFDWDEESTYLREALYLDDVAAGEPTLPSELRDARVLALLGDAVTTDHLSPAGPIPPTGEAGRWLLERDVELQDFNTHPTRRGNHQVLVRAALANPRLNHRLVHDGPGGVARDLAADGPVISMFEAARSAAERDVPWLNVAGKYYDNGSSRDWAAKGPALLGVRAVLAEDFERIHRSNLVGMGVLPLQFQPEDSASSLDLVGDESFTVTGLDVVDDGPTDRPAVVTATPPDGSGRDPIRLETDREVTYHRHGGIMPFVLRSMLDDVKERGA